MNATAMLERAADERATAAQFAALDVRSKIRPLFRRHIAATVAALNLKGE